MSQNRIVQIIEPCFSKVTRGPPKILHIVVVVISDCEEKTCYCDYSTLFNILNTQTVKVVAAVLMASKREYRLDITFDGEIAEDFEQFWHNYELTARQNIPAKLWSDEDDAPMLLVLPRKATAGKIRLVCSRITGGR